MIIRNMFQKLVSFFVLTAALECKDEIGNAIDSWEILKFPQSTSYVFSTETESSPYDLNSTSSGALAETIQQLWTPGIQYAIYNDEPPYATGYNFSVAHAKAVFFWDSVSAVGIFHSIPQFPVGPGLSPSYIGLLPNAWEYAQHVVCVSIPVAELNSVLASLAAMSPRVYDGSLPSPALPTPLIDCSYIPVGDRIVIAKPSIYQVDIWSTCIAGHFSTDLQVISWVHGTTDGPSCGQTDTVDISEITYPFGESYSNYDNHAKWGVGTSPLVCFGDLNRVESQMQRSGAVLCWKDLEIYNSLTAIVASTNSC